VYSCIHFWDHYNNHRDKLALAKYKTFRIECTLNDYENLPETTLGQRVTKLRKKYKMNKKELAIKSGLTETTLYNVETDSSFPNMSTVRKLCKSLNTSPRELLRIDGMSEDTPGQIIKKYRLIKGLSQEELAHICNLHKSTIKDYEDGNIKGNSETLKLIYAAIDYKSLL
jgi:transcriptional regulator with XRE-family HTH domain